MGALSLWLATVRVRVDECVAALKQANPSAAEQLLSAAAARFGPDHPDAALVRPLAVPLIIIANKLDVFKDRERLFVRLFFSTSV